MIDSVNMHASGSASSDPALFAEVGDSLFFTANDGFYGEELYVTSGSGERRATDLAFGLANAQFRVTQGFHEHLFYSRVNKDSLYQCTNGQLYKTHLCSATQFLSLDSLLFVGTGSGIAAIWPDASMMVFAFGLNPCDNMGLTLFLVGRLVYARSQVGILYYLDMDELVAARPDLASSALTLSPNPAKDKLHIGKALAQVQITDASGKIVLHKTRVLGGENLNVASLPRGLYQLTGFMSGQLHRARFVKE